jgi:hypothetical protein
MSWTKTHREEVIQQAYRWSQSFSWKKTAAETRNVYAKVLGYQ